MNEKELLQAIATNIRMQRVKMNISQETLSGFIDISQTQLSALENGAALPKITTLVKLAEVFGTTVDDLLH